MPKLNLVKPPPIIDVMDISFVMPIQEEFHKTFEVPISNEMKDLYLKLVEEEHEEWIEDFFSDAPPHRELKELADVLYVTSGYALQLGYKDIKAIACKPTDTWDWTITEFVGELAGGNTNKQTIGKLIYCLFAYADECGWDLTEAYKRVHISNMSKLTAEGKVLRREDGKVKKSNLYREPDLTDLTNLRGYQNPDGN